MKKHVNELLANLYRSSDTTSTNLHDHIVSWLETDWGSDRPSEYALTCSALIDMAQACHGALQQLGAHHTHFAEAHFGGGEKP